MLAGPIYLLSLNCLNYSILPSPILSLTSCWPVLFFLIGWGRLWPALIHCAPHNILYQKDMTSPMHSSQAASAGQRDTEAVNFLEKKMKNNPSLPFQETIQVRVFLFLKSGLNEGMQHIWVNKDLNH